MITLHHLAFSRSIRILWLLEELGVEYDLVTYERTKAFRAPPELAEIHPLGKSPVIVDNHLVLAESSAILRYIYAGHGNGMLTPPPGTEDHARHDEWLDFVEGSAAMPILALLRAKMQGKGEAAVTDAKPAADKALAYIANGIGNGPWLLGQDLSLADMQMSYLLAMGEAAGSLDDHPALVDYLERIRQHPSFIKATSIGGKMLPENLTG